MASIIRNINFEPFLTYVQENPHLYNQSATGNGAITFSKDDYSLSAIIEQDVILLYLYYKNTTNLIAKIDIKTNRFFDITRRGRMIYDLKTDIAIQKLTSQLIFLFLEKELSIEEDITMSIQTFVEDGMSFELKNLNSSDVKLLGSLKKGSLELEAVYGREGKINIYLRTNRIALCIFFYDEKSRKIENMYVKGDKWFWNHSDIFANMIVKVIHTDEFLQLAKKETMLIHKINVQLQRSNDSK